jgi:hypothetical protein
LTVGYNDRLLTWRISTLRSCDGAAANDFGSWGRHGFCREYGSSRMHGHYPERPAMVGAEPNKMRLGKLGTCLAFRHGSRRAISQRRPDHDCDGKDRDNAYCHCQTILTFIEKDRVATDEHRQLGDIRRNRPRLVGTKHGGWRFQERTSRGPFLV